MCFITIAKKLTDTEGEEKESDPDMYSCKCEHRRGQALNEDRWIPDSSGNLETSL